MQLSTIRVVQACMRRCCYVRTIRNWPLSLSDHAKRALTEVLVHAALRAPRRLSHRSPPSMRASPHHLAAPTLAAATLAAGMALATEITLTTGMTLAAEMVGDQAANETAQ